MKFHRGDVDLARQVEQRIVKLHDLDVTVIDVVQVSKHGVGQDRGDPERSRVLTHSVGDVAFALSRGASQEESNGPDRSLLEVIEGRG